MGDSSTTGNGASPVRLKLPGYLLVPFGRPTCDMARIGVAGVCGSATYLHSDMPCACIDSTAGVPLRLKHFPFLFPERFESIRDPLESFKFICGYIKYNCGIQSDAERRFLYHYFSWCGYRLLRAPRGTLSSAQYPPADNPNWVFSALMPLPQAHVYLADPAARRDSFVAPDMLRVDFAFWTGRRLVAVEINKSSEMGSPEVRRKDALLEQAGISVVHVLNYDLVRYGDRAIVSLLPPEITYFWEGENEREVWNPLFLYE